MKDQWDSLASPKQVNTILGLIPEYKYINKLLEHENLSDNPAL